MDLYSTMKQLVTTFCLLLLLLLSAACSRETPAPEPATEPVAMARVMAEGTGLFALGPDALAPLGWDAAAPLTLEFDGATLPLQALDGTLYFFLPDSVQGRYSNQFVLWLHHGSGESAVEPSGEESPAGDLRLAQRFTGKSQWSPKHIGDPWFWKTLVAPVGHEQEILTPGRSAGEVTVWLRSAGVTDIEHSQRLVVDGEPAGEMRWFGQERSEEAFSIDLPAGDRLTIAIELPEELRGRDISMLDEIEVSYPVSRPVAVEGLYTVQAGEAGRATIEQVSDAMAWQLEPALAALPAANSAGGVEVALPAGLPVAITPRSAARAATIEAATIRPLESAGADYLVVSHPLFVPALEPLLAHHRATGLSVMVLDPQTIYDHFSSGNVDPLAIRSLLQSAAEGWEVTPRFVLLVGDSTYDPAGNLGDDPDRLSLPPGYLPSPFIPTVFGGETISDNQIADLDGDGYPDVALGRLPAQSAEQIETIVNKMLAYIDSPVEGAWRDRVLFAADGREPLFEQTSETIRRTVGDAIGTETIYPAADSDAMSQILPALNQGHLIVNYVGHGSVRQWGRDQLLTADAAKGLTNGEQLSLFINMTCLTGLFSHPTEESLSESLLWTPTGGAVASIAPSSLTLPTNQTRLNEALLEELLKPERPTIGEALMWAKQKVPLNSENDHDIVATFNLIGDPALRLATP